MSKKISVARICLILVGILIIADGIAAALCVNFHWGIVFTLLLGAGLLVIGMFFKTIAANVRGGLLIAFFSLVLLMLGLISALYIGGSGSNVDFDEDAVIVLGAGVRGDEPSASLKSRLDAAVDYHFKNPTALIVVSGGCGEGERISEALAMERYLTDRGVDPDVIIKEEAATSTSENFSYSKELLDSLLGDDFKFAFITSDFHVFRAAWVARESGFGTAGHIGAGASPVLFLPNGLRECAAILKYWFLKY